MTLREKLGELYGLGAIDIKHFKADDGKSVILYRFPEVTKYEIATTSWLEGIEQIDPFPIDMLFDEGFERVSVERASVIWIIQGFHRTVLFREQSEMKALAVAALLKRLREFKESADYKNYKMPRYPQYYADHGC